MSDVKALLREIYPTYDAIKESVRDGALLTIAAAKLFDRGDIDSDLAQRVRKVRRTAQQRDQQTQESGRVFDSWGG